mmetsp:Transcript_24432/g.56940  ORF Transcript_24432/g.56940 Transcript_24432/m.56940 type:complete len:106 (-) Transcript_24432:1202-1519(-)
MGDSDDDDVPYRVKTPQGGIEAQCHPALLVSVIPFLRQVRPIIQCAFCFCIRECRAFVRHCAITQNGAQVVSRATTHAYEDQDMNAVPPLPRTSLGARRKYAFSC